MCLDTHGEFALPARDYSVVAHVSGWFDRLLQSRLAAPGCPAYALCWTPQAQGTCTYRLESLVAKFYAARPALRGSRTSEGLSASVARSPPIGVTFSEKGDCFVRLRYCVGSPPRFSRELSSAPAAIEHTPTFVYLTLGRLPWILIQKANISEEDSDFLSSTSSEPNKAHREK